MKRLFFIAIIIFALCSMSFAQSVEKDCQSIKIQAPELIYKGEVFSAVVSNSDNKKSVTTPIRWKVIKGNKVVETIENEEIWVNSGDVDKDDLIIILAEVADEKCRTFAVSKILITVRAGSPLIFDQYGKLDWADEKVRLDYVASSFQQYKDQTDFQSQKLFAILLFKKTTPKNIIKNRLAKILNHLSSIGGIEKRQILFLIAEADTESASYQLIPSFMENSISDGAFTIRGDEFANLENLFQSTIKNRKK